MLSRRNEQHGQRPRRNLEREFQAEMQVPPVVLVPPADLVPPAVPVPPAGHVPLAAQAFFTPKAKRSRRHSAPEQSPAWGMYFVFYLTLVLFSLI